MSMEKTAKILIIEDDAALREALTATLELAGYPYVALPDAQQAMLVVARETIGLVITDVNLPEINGIQLLESLNKHYPLIPVIIMTAYSSVKNAVAAMQKGALDYLAKPFSHQELLTKIEEYYSALVFDQGSDSPVAEDPASLALLVLAKKVAQSDASVLILGESGTGKEVLARYIHQHSDRRHQAFIAINCAAIPETMLEATLFGHEKGAFSGAYQSYPGKFEQANGGTLLLDEVSEMPLALQAKLLRVLQEKEVERIGGKKTIALDVRVLATTNRDLKKEIGAGNFREDLYYRLHVFPLRWLPLRERPGDILAIADYCLHKIGQKKEQKKNLRFDSAAKEKLLAYGWPGNVRELDNVIQRAVILAQGQWITAEDLFLEEQGTAEQAVIEHKNDMFSLAEVKSVLQEPALNEQSGELDARMQVHEFQMIADVLKETQGSRRVAAQKLGISPRTLRYKMAKMREQGLSL